MGKKIKKFFTTYEIIVNEFLDMLWLTGIYLHFIYEAHIFVIKQIDFIYLFSKYNLLRIVKKQKRIAGSSLLKFRHNIFRTLYYLIFYENVLIITLPSTTNSTCASSRPTSFSAMIVYKPVSFLWASLIVILVL